MLIATLSRALIDQRCTRLFFYSHPNEPGGPIISEPLFFPCRSSDPNVGVDLGSTQNSALGFSLPFQPPGRPVPSSFFVLSFAPSIGRTKSRYSTNSVQTSWTLAPRGGPGYQTRRYMLFPSLNNSRDSGDRSLAKPTRRGWSHASVNDSPSDCATESTSSARDFVSNVRRTLLNRATFVLAVPCSQDHRDR